ncbi:hypothetical protein ABFS83_12G001100 [Erythranthe nasuta]
MSLKREKQTYMFMLSHKTNTLYIIIKMDVEKVFQMKGGIGENSYWKNSSLQKRAADKVKHIITQAMEEMYVQKKPKSIGIADLGCSTGPNTLSNIKQLVHTVLLHPQPQPEFRVFLNDLPTNDFNTLFQSLPDFYTQLNPVRRIYIAAYPGSFYGRLFPDHSLHFIYSSNSLHWLSKIPAGIYDEHGFSINKKSIYISERSTQEVSLAYLKQFQHDFSLFLKSRSQELVCGGRMVLILLGRTGSHHADRGNSVFWEIMYRSLSIMVDEGEIDEEKLESYEVHFYAPSKEELEDEVRKEGSFKMDVLEMFQNENENDIIIDADMSYGTAVAKTVRSIQESMLANHFGDSILDKLFQHYATLLDQELSAANHHINSMITTVLVLTKL